MCYKARKVLFYFHTEQIHSVLPNYTECQATIKAFLFLKITLQYGILFLIITVATAFGFDFNKQIKCLLLRLPKKKRKACLYVIKAMVQN